MMRLTGLLRRKWAAQAVLVLLLAVLITAGWAALAWAEGPRPWELGMQPPATPVKDRLNAFHNELLVIIFLIAGFVMALLLYVILRFNHRRNPVPSHFSHNPVIEVLWTVVPVLILVIIAIPSFKLMYYMDRIPHPDMTIKVTGHQWYWSYEYPDQKDLAFDSNIIQEADLKPGQKRLLDVDNPLVVPIHTNIRVLVTSTDVIHSWFIPSFGVQEYAIIGRLNESWFNVDHQGTYYGECNQICGINHAFMPIKIVALSKPDFQKWLVTAQKKFASNQTDGSGLRVAAVSAPAGK
ncbi:MAG TPA: cytochrome c oxidase subunit II [Stellaceae bacterium]|nr:cytochrome c oxidase subunit II [Stellaceae bacterium]